MRKLLRIRDSPQAIDAGQHTLALEAEVESGLEPGRGQNVANGVRAEVPAIFIAGVLGGEGGD